MKKIPALCISIFGIIGFSLHGYSQDHAETKASTGSNYTGFSSDRVQVTPELETLTDKEFRSHPEYGVLPYNAPCTDCIELLQKRDEHHRYFVKKGTNGKEFYAQTSYGTQSYYDLKGVLRTIDTRIRPLGQPGVYAANNQPNPVLINISEKFTSLLNAGKELQVNRDLSIYVQHKNGSVTSLGTPDWSNYTAGDDGIVVHNFYPGIDLKMQVGRGKVESSYIVNKPLSLGDGWLVIRDNMKVPSDCIYDYSHCEKGGSDMYTGTLFINDKAGTPHFFIGAPAAYDENGQKDNVISLSYSLNNSNRFDLYVPIDWMSDANRSYPLVIDPVFSVVTTLPQANITGSGYNATCFQNGCSYPLAVNVPAAATITDIQTSFWFLTLGACTLDKGAWDITTGACRYPTAGTWNTCNIPIPGRCQLPTTSCWLQVKNCIPAPQCPAYTIPFVLNFYRCTQPGAGCGFSCVIADSPWDMTVTGLTMDLAPGPDQTICVGQSANISALATNGAAPFTYTWTPGNLNGSNVSVSPAVTTVYTVTASDCPGNSLQANVTVNVNPNDNPGFVINPNPACAGQQVTITGNGAALASSYDWLTPGANTASTNDQQTINVTYANAGNYNITLRWTSPVSGCVFDVVLPVAINPGVSPTATISVVPSGPVCAGTQVTFSSNVSLAGTYQWQVDGVDQPGEINPTFVTSGLTNGQQVTLKFTANGVVCGNPQVISSPIVMVVNPIVIPGVIIAANPAGTLCPGQNVTFTANPTNGGTTPGYQWQINGAGNFGSNSTFTTNSLNSGDQVSVIMTSTDPCPNPATATSNVIVVTVYPLVTVTTAGDATTCPGEPSQICATAADGNGGPYNYSWSPSGGNTDCITVSPSSTTVYTVSATDGCNSNPAKGTVTITVLPGSTPDFTYSPSDVSILSPTVSFKDLTTNGTVVSWDFGDSACGNNTSVLANPTHTFCKPGIYTVKLVTTNPSGCLDSVTYTVEIRNEYYYYIPNSFTPNGDGFNDFFGPQGTDALQSEPLNYTMSIYNRWGEKIFETENTSLPWTGVANDGGKVVEAGVYVYRIVFQNQLYSDKELVGSVTVVR